MEENIEIWKSLDFLGYPDYMVSNMGKVKSLKFGKEKILRQCKLKDGYLYVSLSKNNKQKTFKVHRLVAQMFIPNPYNLPQVNHKNEIKTDNNVNNLEWCTASYNNSYGTRLERVSKTSGKKIIGTNEKETLTFNSAREAGRNFNKTSSNIISCANGNLNTAYGYVWRWA
jgi:hypothetical protein